MIKYTRAGGEAYTATGAAVDRAMALGDRAEALAKMDAAEGKVPEKPSRGIFSDSADLLESSDVFDFSLIHQREMEITGESDITEAADGVDASNRFSVGH
jgi:hypothetical protein